MTKKTLDTSASFAAPFRIILYTFPVWGAFLLLMFVMPMTGLVGSIIIAISLFLLPFKARRGVCPRCTTVKLFPFSGFGNACKGCGGELVLRGKIIHLLEKRSDQAVAGTGRSNR
ncbi:MAG: hypothetical protein R8M46_05040 [Ghiorsea sp.]